MFRQKPILTYVIFTLMGIGIFMQILEGSQTLLTAVIVFGLIYLLYRFPPTRWKRMGKQWKWKQSVKSSQKHAARNFRVIEGKKKKESERPPYH